MAKIFASFLTNARAISQELFHNHPLLVFDSIAYHTTWASSCLEPPAIDVLAPLAPSLRKSASNRSITNFSLTTLAAAFFPDCMDHKTFVNRAFARWEYGKPQASGAAATVSLKDCTGTMVAADLERGIV